MPFLQTFDGLVCEDGACVATRVDGVASGELHRAATAEMAFSRYLLANSERLTTEAGALIRRLTAYLDERAE